MDSLEAIAVKVGVRRPRRRTCPLAIVFLLITSGSVAVMQVSTADSRLLIQGSDSRSTCVREVILLPALDTTSFEATSCSGNLPYGQPFASNALGVRVDFARGNGGT